MKHNGNGIYTKMLCVILMLILMISSTVSASAATSVPGIDPDATGSLVIRERESTTDKAITGLKVLLYKIGDIDVKEFALVPSKNFEKLGCDFSKLDTVENQTLVVKSAKEYIAENKIAEEVFSMTDDKGEALFEKLPIGLYLVVFEGEGKGIPDSFLVQMPTYSEELGDYEYDIVAFPKTTTKDEVTSRTVTKVWKDDGNKLKKRPDFIKVSLYCDGKLFDTVELSEKNAWSYTWDTLDKESEWTAKEEGIPSGYVGNVTYDGDKIVITNTYTEGHLPKTGQDYQPVFILLIIGIVLVATGVTMFVVSSKKKKNDK